MWKQAYSIIEPPWFWSTSCCCDNRFMQPSKTLYSVDGHKHRRALYSTCTLSLFFIVGWLSNGLPCFASVILSFWLRISNQLKRMQIRMYVLLVGWDLACCSLLPLLLVLSTCLFHDRIIGHRAIPKNMRSLHWIKLCRAPEKNAGCYRAFNRELYASSLKDKKPWSWTLLFLEQVNLVDGERSYAGKQRVEMIKTQMILFPPWYVACKRGRVCVCNRIVHRRWRWWWRSWYIFLIIIIIIIILQGEWMWA